MVRKLWTLILAMGLLAGSAFAAFIQNPIPPSTQGNSLLDEDGDGRLDKVSIKFLGSINQDYLDQFVDSLSFDWIDSYGFLTHVVAPHEFFKLDPNSSRSLIVDLSKLQRSWLQFTALSSESYSKENLGNFKLHMTDGTAYNVAVQDKMLPVIKDAVLRGYRGMRADTLSLSFSEKSYAAPNCETFLEYKSEDDFGGRLLPLTYALWSDDGNKVLVIFDEFVNQEKRLGPRDSIRLLNKCFGDYAKNVVDEESKYVVVAGHYPLEVQTSAMAVDNHNFDKNTPVFQLAFRNRNANVPSESEWGFSMDVMDEGFLSAVRSAAGLSSKAALDLSKIQIRYSLRIYAKTGEFVAETSVDVKGDDPRFDSKGNKLFLKWNFMDANRRRIGTGVYISDFVVHVTYGDMLVYRNDRGETTSFFGVKRR